MEKYVGFLVLLQVFRQTFTYTILLLCNYDLNDTWEFSAFE